MDKQYLDKSPENASPEQAKNPSSGVDNSAQQEKMRQAKYDEELQASIGRCTRI